MYDFTIQFCIAFLHLFNLACPPKRIEVENQSLVHFRGSRKVKRMLKRKAKLDWQIGRVNRLLNTVFITMSVKQYCIHLIT
jgi:hypothetical protein